MLKFTPLSALFPLILAENNPKFMFNLKTLLCLNKLNF